ncbi:MAG: divalent-cation tolerance protein CutA [Acidobacteriaceae bacterium]
MDLRLILTTCASRDEAERIARSLVEDRLAACVNLIAGVTSVYRWQGAVDNASETLLLIKTTAGRVDQVETALRRLHSYELPEFLVLSVDSASELYAAWIGGSV